MKAPTTITEAIEQLEKVAAYYFESLHAKDRQPKVTRNGELGEEPDESDSDLHIEVDEWILVTPFHTVEEYKVIGGVRHRKAIHYQIAKVVVTPGCHGGPPDSWCPDDVDIVPIPELKPTTVLQAIETVCKLMLENELDHIGTSWSENEMATEEEEWP